MSESEKDLEELKAQELDSDNSTEEAAPESDAASSFEEKEVKDSESNEQQNTKDENNESTGDDIEIISADSVPEDSDNKVLEPDTRKYHITKGDIIRYVILGISVLVFAFAAFKLIQRVVVNKINRNNNKNVEESVVSVDEDTTTTEAIDDNGDSYININPDLSIDFDSLYAINDRAVGWLQIPSLSLKYPIVQGDDNDYYLKHDISKNEAWSGAIYLDYRSHPALDEGHATIYGHHMDDGSMFAGLLKYDDESFFVENQANYNNYVYIYLPDLIRVYQIFAVTDVYFDTNVEAFTLKFDTNFTEQDYLDYIKSVQKYDTGISVKDTDQLITLFTCQSDSTSDERHLVHAKLVTTISN